MNSKQRPLPVLDIRTFHEQPEVFIEKIRHAFHNVGFCLLKHDLHPGLATRQLEETRMFFQQPIDKKLQISYESSPCFRGYMKMGVENTAGRVDLREQVEVATDYECSQTNSQTKQAPYERLRGTNQWPDAFQPTLQETTTEFVSQMCRIADCIRKAMTAALGLDMDALDPIFERNDEKNDIPHWVLKLISYPAVAIDNDEPSFGVGAHCDTNFLTLVLQDDVGGLQAFSDGDWIDVPCNNARNEYLVINLGEQAEILSRGYFLATPHRVMANTTSAKRARVSVPLFYNPHLSAAIEPLESISDTLVWERPRDYDRWRQKQNTMLRTVGENTLKSLARSHPAVFERHHPDLVILDDGRVMTKSACDSS